MIVRRHAIFGVTLAAFALAPRLARAEDPDPWFGRDKALHFGASAILATAGYAAASPIWDEVPARAVAGASVSLAFGVGKEVYDATGAGDPSWRDFTWDVVGTAVGVGLSILVDVTLFPSEAPGNRPGVTRAGLHF